jgi:hypothetical protein
MAVKQKRTRVPWLLLALGALALVLTACFKDPTLRWTEDVVLPDARVVTLKREQHFDEGGFVAAHWFEFQHPVTRELVRWNTDGFFRLVALFLVQDVPHILVKPTFGKQLEQAGCPDPSMFIYRYEAPAWVQVPYAQSPVRVVRNNVTTDPKADRKLIETNGFKVPAGGIHTRYAKVREYAYGINLDRYPAQTFKCPAQKRINFQ